MTLSNRSWLLFWVLMGCVRTPPATLAPTRAAVYDVVVAVASADRQVEAVYVLSVDAIASDVAVYATLSSSGLWTEEASAITFDSENPKRSDPWPITLQNAIAAVPATVQLDRAGAPLALLSPEDWKRTAIDEVYGLDLPVEALSSGEALIDPPGVIADLKRNFPGVPQDEVWERSERIAGVGATRRERCTKTQETGRLVWTCEGDILGPETGPARLHDTLSSTRIEVDRWGLRLLETTYAGTLVLLGPGGEGVLDRPVAGKRLVRRR